MQDRTINAALIILRARIIRGEGEGREPVEALLGLRGVPLPPVWPGKRPDAANSGAMKRLLLAALRDGPRPMCELVGVVADQRPDLGRAAIHRRTDKAVQRLRLAGLIVRENRMCRWVWRSLDTPKNQGRHPLLALRAS